MFEDYYFDDPTLLGLLDAIGFYPQAIEPMPMAPPIMDVGVPLVAAPAVAPSLIDVAAAAAPAEPTPAPAEPTPAPAEPTPAPAEPVPAPMTQEDREARRIAANTPPLGTSIVGPTADGDPLAFGTGNTFNVREGQEVRLVDAGGNVIVSGSGVEGANQAVAAAQSLSDELGGAANFKIQTGERTINPDGSVGATRYIDVARAAPSQSGLGFLADAVLPFAASFIPVIGPVAGAALGSAASSAAQGRDLEDALKRAAIAAGSAYLGGQVFGPASPGTTPPTGGVNADLVPNALKGLNFGSLPSASIPAGVGGDIVALAAKKAASNIVGSTLGNVVGSAAPSVISAPPSAPTEQPTPEEIEAQRNPIVVKARTEPLQLTQDTAGLGSALAGLPALSGLTPDANLVNYSEPYASDIVVTANVPTVTQDVGLGSALAGLPAILAPMTPDPALAAEQPSENKFDFNDVFGTGLSVPQLLSIGGIGADLLKNLLAGSGGAGPTTPYVSPFGTGVGIGAGRDMRANPNIIDYERYGFGPEAMFFQPGYGLLSAGAAPQAQPIMAAPQAQPAMVTNPRYEPLI